MTKFHQNTLKAQRDRIVRRLRRGPITTLELRREEDVLAPAPRIFELRNLGYDIRTLLVVRQSDAGQLHGRIALYILQSEPETVA